MEDELTILRDGPSGAVEAQLISRGCFRKSTGESPRINLFLRHRVERAKEMFARRRGRVSWMSRWPAGFQKRSSTFARVFPPECVGVSPTEYRQEFSASLSGLALGNLLPQSARRYLPFSPARRL